MPSIRLCTVSSRPRGVKDTSLAHEPLSKSLAFDVAAFSASKCFELILVQLDRFFDAIYWEIAHARRKTAAYLREILVVGDRTCDIAAGIARNPGPRSATVSVVAVHVVIAWCGDGVRAGPQDRIPHKDISVGPEGIVEAVRPEYEGEEVAVEEGPEYRSVPAAPSPIPAAVPMIAPLVPRAMPMIVAPLI